MSVEGAARHYRWDDLAKEQLNPQLSRRIVTGESVMREMPLPDHDTTCRSAPSARAVSDP